MLFLGMYNHSVDSKNRLVLPSKFISKLSESIYISIGFDGCLEIRNEKDFKEYSEKLLELPNTSRDARQIQRVFLSLSSKVEVDGSKRVLVPVNLLQKASIDKDVMIIGVGKTIEIWNKTKFEAYSKEAESKYEEAAERVSNNEHNK